jgi:hypothetical protein
MDARSKGVKLVSHYSKFIDLRAQYKQNNNAESESEPDSVIGIAGKMGVGVQDSMKVCRFVCMYVGVCVCM